MGPTVEEFARGEWLDQRKVSKHFAWKDDLSRLVHHFFPTFGKRRLIWLSTDEGARAAFAWAIGLRSHKAQRDGKPLAPRSVWNVYSVAKVLLDDAVELRRLERNPLASFRTDKHLPQKSDKLDGWRERAGFELDQVVALTTDPRLLAHRRVWNTLAFMVGGGRTGELANLRWRDWSESHKGGLGRLTIATSFNTRAAEVKSTKTGAKKLIPVHPFAAQLLRAWRDSGWREWMGREATHEDLITPRRNGRQWGNGQLLRHFHADLDQLGIPRQRQYENRSAFRMLLIGAGAPDFIVDRMTHPAVRQASDWYTRTERLWPAMCDAILKLEHPRWCTGTAPSSPTPQTRTQAIQPSDPSPVIDLRDRAVRRGMAGCTGLESVPGARGTEPHHQATARDDADRPAPAWLTAPDASPPFEVSVDLASFIDAAFEAEAWALDARLARVEAAA